MSPSPRQSCPGVRGVLFLHQLLLQIPKRISMKKETAEMIVHNDTILLQQNVIFLCVHNTHILLFTFTKINLTLQNLLHRVLIQIVGYHIRIMENVHLIGN